MVVGSVCWHDDVGFAMFGLRLLRLGSLFGRRVGLAALVGRDKRYLPKPDLCNIPCTYNALHPSGLAAPMQQLNALHRHVTIIHSVISLMTFNSDNIEWVISVTSALLRGVSIKLIKSNSWTYW